MQNPLKWFFGPRASSKSPPNEQVSIQTGKLVEGKKSPANKKIRASPSPKQRLIRFVTNPRPPLY
jgi:hypothetical protein